MAEGVKKGEVHAVFVDRLRELQCRDAGAISDAVMGTGQRIWQIPEGLANVDLFDIANLHKPVFDRTEINDNYVDVMKSPEDDEAGTIGDTISLKNQIDYNAMEERAFRLRHASAVRCNIHAHGRRHGHCISNLFPKIEKQMADMIAMGAATGDTTA